MFWSSLLKIIEDTKELLVMCYMYLYLICTMLEIKTEKLKMYLF